VIGRGNVQWLKVLYVWTVAVADIDLKVASKFFGGRFACGSSVTGDDEIVIQGDVKDELFDVLTEKWPQVCTHQSLHLFTLYLTNHCVS